MFRDEVNKWKRYVDFPDGDYNETEPTENKQLTFFDNDNDNRIEKGLLKQSPVVTTHWKKDRKKNESNGFGKERCFTCRETYREFRKDHAGAIAFVYDDREKVVLYCPSCYQDKCRITTSRRAKRKIMKS